MCKYIRRTAEVKEDNKEFIMNVYENSDEVEIYADIVDPHDENNMEGMFLSNIGLRRLSEGTQEYVELNKEDLSIFIEQLQKLYDQMYY